MATDTLSHATRAGRHHGELAPMIRPVLHACLVASLFAGLFACSNNVGAANQSTPKLVEPALKTWLDTKEPPERSLHPLVVLSWSYGVCVVGFQSGRWVTSAHNDHATAKLLVWDEEGRHEIGFDIGWVSTPDLVLEPVEIDGRAVFFGREGGVGSYVIDQVSASNRSTVIISFPEHARIARETARKLVGAMVPCDVVPHQEPVDAPAEPGSPHADLG